MNIIEEGEGEQEVEGIKEEEKKKNYNLEKNTLTKNSRRLDTFSIQFWHPCH